MSRILLLFTLLLTISATLGYAQPTPNLNSAFDYAVLSKEQIINFANTSVYGVVGSANRTSVTDNGKLTVVYEETMYEMGTPAAKQALIDAKATFDDLYNLPAQTLNFPTLGGRSLEPGVWRINGNATLNGGLTLNARGDANAVFVIIITGNLTSDVDKAWVNLINGAQPKNVFWIVNGQVNTGKTSLFQGTIIANGSGGITFGSGGIVIGRAIALSGNVTLNDNLVFMPNLVIANLSVMKVADKDDYTVGGTVTYTITATNLGPDDATGVIVKEEVPTGLEFISATPERGTYDSENHVWTIGNLAVNTEVSLRITFKIISTGNIRNRVVIIGDNPDQSPEQDEDEEDIIVSEIGVSKEIVNPKETYYVGDMVRYKITVRNNTTATETNVKIGEKLPDALRYIGQNIVAPQGVEATYNQTTGILHIKSLPGNGVVELFVDAQLIKNGRVENIARIINKDIKPDKPADPKDDYKDSDPENDKEVVVIPDVQCAPLTVNLTANATVHCASVQGLIITATEVIGATYTWTLPTGWVIASGNGTNSIVVTPNALGGAQQVSVTVKDQCNVVVTSAPITINITGTPAVPAINGSNAVCYNATEGTELSTPEMEGYTYTWEVVSGGIKLSGEGARVRVLPVTAADLSGGIVKLTVTNNCGTSNVATKTIIITPAPAKPAAITGDINLCEGSDPVTFTASEVAGATSYTWTYPSDWTVVGEDNGKSLTVMVGKKGGQVTVRAVNECSAGEAAIKEVTVIEQPTVDNFNLSSAKDNLCEGEQLELIATEVPNAKGYNFVVTGGLQIVSKAGNKVIVKAGATGGTVSVTITDFCNRELTVSKDITVTPKLAPATISGEATVCRISTGNVYTANTYNVPVTYKWTASGDLSITKGADTEQVEVSAGTAGGTLTLEVSNENGCFTVTKTFQINTFAPLATPTSITGDVNLCVSRQATFTASNVVGATSYAWTFPSDWRVVGADNERTITVTVGEASGDVSVRAVNACGTGDAVSKPVTVVPQPTINNFSLTSDANNLCEGQTLVLTATQVANAKGYEFAATGGLQIVKTDGNKVTVKAGATGGTVSVTITDFCDRTLTVTKDITVTPKLAAVSITGDAQVCRNSTGNVYTASAYDMPVTYKWTASGDLSITKGADTEQVEVSAGTAGGNLTVEVSNGCFTVSKTFLVKTIAPPALPTAIAGSSEVCEGSTLTYSVPSVTGVTYTWKAPAGWVVTSNGASASVKMGAASGKLMLTASDDCGNSTEIELNINVTKLPVAPTISGPATACAGQEITYTLSGTAAGLTYTWTTTGGWTIKGAATGESITVIAGNGAGNIAVTAKTVSNQCGEASSNMTVGITPAPAAPGAISHDVNVCQNTAGNVISVAEVPGATSYTWDLPLGWGITAGHNTNRITVTTTETGGQVSVTANNCTGSSAPSTTNINITLPPAPVTRITDNSNVCDGLVYTADQVDGATSYTWEVTEGFTIESGQGTPTIKVKATNPNAMGRVSVTAFTGACAGSADYSIDIDAKLADGQLDFPKAFSPNGDGKNDTWLVKNLEKFPENELVIFNRWGSEVFKQKNYKNDWAAQGLGQGTYFYKVQVKLCDGKYQEYSGYLTVFR